MSWQDVLLIVEIILLVAIFLDDHAMRNMAEKSLQISRESLEAQKQYLDLRRRWYEQRSKKREEKNDKAAMGPAPSDMSNSGQSN